MKYIIAEIAIGVLFSRLIANVSAPVIDGVPQAPNNIQALWDDDAEEWFFIVDDSTYGPEVYILKDGTWVDEDGLGFDDYDLMHIIQKSKIDRFQ